MHVWIPSGVATLFALAVVLPNPPAVEAQGSPALTLAKVEALVKLKTPDAAVAGEIGRRGLAFTADKKTIDRLRSLGAGPLAIAAVDATRPALEDVKAEAPALLKQLYEALDQGDLQKARPFLAPELAADTRKLDTICKPFSYRGHYVQGFVERPGRLVELRTRVLLKPIAEYAYVLVAQSSGDRLVIRDVLPPPEDWFAAELTSAQDAARKFVHALKAGRQDVMIQLISEGMSADPVLRGRCGDAVRAMGEVGDSRSFGMTDAKGLKATAGVSVRGGGEWRFQAEPVDGTTKIVRYDAGVRGCRPEEDGAMEARTLKRFGLEAEATRTAEPRQADAPGGVDPQTVATLLQETGAALQAGDTQTAFKRLDEILEATGALTIPACREGSGFGKCALGGLTVGATEVKFVDSGGATLFATKPSALGGVDTAVSRVLLTRSSVARLKLRVADKSYNLNFVVQADGCERSKYYACLEGSRGLEMQSALARYLARTIERLMALGSGPAPAPLK